ncbi:unnamed protein product [Toxocara canis]|uniref:SLC3A2_N domain-containing protein n=1 Tax=Toxocara canis TaxID=6265 RepID=A0A183TUZ4_TOXCA|nr:unnamed protein product [Toxocara canis]
MMGRSITGSKRVDLMDPICGATFRTNIDDCVPPENIQDSEIRVIRYVIPVLGLLAAIAYLVFTIIRLNADVISDSGSWWPANARTVVLFQEDCHGPVSQNKRAGIQQHLQEHNVPKDAMSIGSNNKYELNNTYADREGDPDKFGHRWKLKVHQISSFPAGLHPAIGGRGRFAEASFRLECE